MSEIRADFGHMSIQQLVNHYEKGQLNLEPGFQRNSVWSGRDRTALIDSIFTGFPLPSIFLYRRQDARGHMVYDVIDGKQRLESIFMFMGLKGFRGQRFQVKTKLTPQDEEADWYDWTSVRRYGGDFRFSGYKIQTVEVSGELGDIIQLFVRINSTGKKLTSAEKRHAKYFNSPFLKRTGTLAEKYVGYYEYYGILSDSAISRMKHVELTCELLASIGRGELLNKKKSLDDIIGGESVGGAKLDKAQDTFKRIANMTEKMFPRLAETRFANAVDFYSLFMLVWELDRNGAVLRDRSRNREAERLLIWLSQGLDKVRQQQRKVAGVKEDQQIFVDYLMTVQGDTDSLASRERRATILRGLLAGLFEKKDSQRIFSKEQRRLIWHSDGAKRCSHPGCNVVLDWNNFTIDHVEPFALGGKTTRENAALMCKKHNSMKGARPRRTRRAGA